MDSQLTDRLWGSIDDTFKAILDHPSIEGLIDGSLELEAFRFYGVSTPELRLVRVPHSELEALTLSLTNRAARLRLVG
jgi:hypothetical protein